MSDTTQNNAMAEIALALAMGFFSIMVLTMVSMGGSMVSQTQSPHLSADPMALGKTQDDQPQEALQGSQSTVKREELILFYNGEFRDAALNVVAPSQIAAQDKIILAVDPDLSMSETMKARQTLSHDDITVVMLNKGWLARLREEMP